MALLEALSTDYLNFLMYDAIPPAPCTHQTSAFPENGSGRQPSSSSVPQLRHRSAVSMSRRNLAVQCDGKKKRRRRRSRVCKDKDEAEAQRMTHIAVERNRRRQMKEYVAVLRSLMPESYVQRGDQASIVGGAIEFVKELEQHVQSLEAQKLQVPSPPQGTLSPPFSQFFGYPQYTWTQLPNMYTSKSKEATADIEVTLIESHANVRILSRRSPRKLSKMVVGFHMLHLTILHLNVTTLGQLVLYSISAKVEEGCQLTSVDDIAGAVHHMLTIIEDEGVPS